MGEQVALECLESLRRLINYFKGFKRLFEPQSTRERLFLNKGAEGTEGKWH